MSLSNGLCSVREIWLDSPEQYFIPPYQRGYKWTVQEVRKLLEDINEFSPTGSLLSYYCLQNITLKKGTSTEPITSSVRLNVIDGQQRLTTTFIVLSYFKWKKSQVLTSITSELVYGVRDVTQQFLKDEILSGKIWEIDSECSVEALLSRDNEMVRHLHDGFSRRIAVWESKKRQGKNRSDIFHLYCAAQTVRAFFDQPGIEWKKFETKFLDNVKFLINNVADTFGEAKMFSKINGFRVPLDGADLLRAIFVTDVARTRVNKSGEMDPVRREIRLAEEHVKLGSALDEIAAWWGVAAHNGYFQLLDTSIEDTDKAFDAEQYPINHLYKLYEAACEKKEILLEDFEKRQGEASKLFEDILHLQSILRDWYEDRYIYHYAGYLCSQCGCEFYDIFSRLKAARSRRDFYKEMKTEILTHLVTWVDESLVDPPEWQDLDKKSLLEKRYERWLTQIDADGYNWYGNSALNVGKVLVLLDVIAFTTGLDDNSDFHPLSDHLDAAFFEICDEDKEHIFPQTPIGVESMKDISGLRKAVKEYWNLVQCRSLDKQTLGKKWEQYWNSCEKNDPLRDDPFSIDDITQTEYNWLLDDQNNARERTKERINGFVSRELGIDLNSIGNIVLLNSGTNRSYGNDFYPKKRQRILSDYRKNLSIRLHTRSVFAKEFPMGMMTLEDTSFDAWTQNSIKNNRQFIKIQIMNFFEEVFHV